MDMGVELGMGPQAVLFAKSRPWEVIRWYLVFGESRGERG